MAEHIHTFDEDSLSEVAETVRRMQAQQYNLGQMLQRIQRDSPGAVIRGGVTATNKEFPDYPDCGCTFVVRFADLQFDETPGTCDHFDLQPDEWEAKTVIASAYGGHYISEGCYVLIFKAPAVLGSQWWILPPTQHIIRFQLITDLCPDSCATAYQMRCDGAFCGDPLTVCDTIGKWHGYGNASPGVGYQGWAVRMFDGDPCNCGKWEILFLEAPCRWLQFKLAEDNPQQCDENPALFGMKAHGIRCWGSAPNGRDPTLPMADAQGLFQVYDPCGLFPHAKKDSCGYAVYDETDRGADCFGKYKILHMDQMSPTGMAEVGQDPMCQSGAVDVANFEPCMFAPFSQKMDVETAQNPFGLCGEPGDKVFLNWCETLCEYVVTQVEHKQEYLVTDLDQFDNWEHCNYGLKVTKRQFCVQYCNQDEQSADVLFPTIECDVLESIGLAGGDVTSTDNDTAAGCRVVQTKQTICVWGVSCPTPGNPEIVFEFKAFDALVDMGINNTPDTADSTGNQCITATSQLIYVPCYSDATTTECVIDLTECPTDSTA